MTSISPLLSFNASRFMANLNSSVIPSTSPPQIILVKMSQLYHLKWKFFSIYIFKRQAVFKNRTQDNSNILK